MTSPIDEFLGHPVWRHTHRGRLVPLGDSVRVTRHLAGEVLFKQFHPADQLSLLYRGAVGHETNGETEGEIWSMGSVSWPWSTLGWSGFLPPYRNGTTARAQTDLELLSWRHEELATHFYSDPPLAVDFFRIVLDSVRRQFERARRERLLARKNRPPFDPMPHGSEPARHRFAPSLITTLRRSPFFEQFDDTVLERLAARARLVRRQQGEELLQQGADTGGIWVLAAGGAMSYFCAYDSSGERRDRFRTLAESGAIVAGIPTVDGGYCAEATVVCSSTCWLYQIPTESLEHLIAADPEFGRSFMQRQLVRLAHLISAARVPKPSTDDEPEIAAVKSILEQNQARIPVTSDLHKIPHLLDHRLTIGNAFACLNTVRNTGHYQERALARICIDLLDGLQAELHFYRDVLDAYVEVTETSDCAEPAAVRARCDIALARAFAHLRTEVHGIDNLPRTAGHIVIMNHLACPAHYELPNHYHFSFDTGFVSMLLHQHYGASPVRVVRASPGVEYGHNIFYGRLGHITVPTLESAIDDVSLDRLARFRRESSERLVVRGGAALRQGENVLICPEGQSQRACDSPTKFYSGAFRLALSVEPEPYIVPVALAGFDQRYKDTKLVALIQQPFRLSQALARHDGGHLRAFLDDYRTSFAEAVKSAQRMSRVSSARVVAAARASERPR